MNISNILYKYLANEYLVVKDDSSRINYPNIELSLSSKDLFIKKFESRLEKYNKNSIITSIYQQVFNVCKHDDKNYKNVYNLPSTNDLSNVHLTSKIT